MPALLKKFATPEDTDGLARYQRLTLVVLLASIPITAIAILATPGEATPLTGITLGLLLLLAWRWFRWSFGGRWHWADIALDVAVIVAASLVVGYPAPMLTLIFMSMFYRPLIGPRRFANVAAIAAALAFIAAAYLTRNNPGAMGWAAVLSQLPLMMVARSIGLMLGSTFKRQADLNGELAEAEQRYRSLVEQLPGVVYTMTLDGKLSYVSPQIRGVIDIPGEQLLGTALADFNYLVHPEDRDRFHAFLRNALEQRSDFKLDIRCQTPERGDIWIQTRAKMMRDAEGELSHWLGTFDDVTAQKELEHQLAFQAYHDNLTGLPNRRLSRDRLEHALTRGAATNTLVGVLFLDLDNFKIVNDSLGHQAGDELIQAIARRLEAIKRAGDTVGRIGGDEFLLLLENLAGEQDAIRVAERIFEALAAELELRGRSLAVSASIGIAFASGPDVDADDLIRHADMAMYEAKHNGRARYAIYRHELGAQVRERLDIETGLRHALQFGELTTHYQPVIELRTGRITEVEALVRWNHPQRGLLQPATFIDVAEETGLIREIDLWILREACRQVRAWQLAWPEHRDLIASVNLSASQLREPHLGEQVAAILAETGLAPRHLKLEITEHAMVADIQMARQALLRLNELGVQLAIDDFGTGNSALNYLRDFPISTLKIDRSFVTGMRQGSGDPTLVKALITLAGSLGLEVTAEGIEGDEHLELRRFGCDHGQGYRFARPQAAASMEDQLRAPALDLSIALGPATRYVELAAG